MKIETLLITPKQASELLKQNVNNRPLNKDRVGILAVEMISGRWKCDTGESIKVSRTNKLLDGQHRLAAIIKANVSVKTMVITGLDDDIFDVIDTGKSRSASDVFSIANVKYSSAIPTAIKIYNVMKLGYKNHRTAQNMATNSRLMEQYDLNSTMWNDIMYKSQSLYAKASKILSMSEIAAHIALYREIDEVKALEFMTMVCTGIGITNNTVYALRSKLIESRIDKSHTIVSEAKNALIIKAWNAWRIGKSTNRIKYIVGDETFPIAI